MKPGDDLAAQRGKRGIITIRIGNKIRTIQVPPEFMRDPLDVVKRRKKTT